MPGRSFIPQDDLILVARALAAGKSQPKLVKELGWDTNRMRRCVERLRSETLYEAARQWQKPAQVALEWLRLRGLCTPAELDAAINMARRYVIENLKSTLDIGQRWRELRDFERAQAIYLRHLRDDPNNADVLVELGLCLLDAGDVDEALIRLDEAVTVAPDHARGRYGRAIAFEHAGCFEAAFTDLERAYQLDPDNLYYRTVLAEWRLSQPAERAAAVMTLKGTMVLLLRRHAEKAVDDHYCRQISGRVFSALWNNGFTAEALAAARISQQQGWSSKSIDETVRHEPPPAESLHDFSATVRAHADGHPGHWPADSDGYTVKLSIIARDTKAAEALALEYLYNAEPPSIRFQIELRQKSGWFHPRFQPSVSQVGLRDWNRVPTPTPTPEGPEQSARTTRPGDYLSRPQRRPRPRHRTQSPGRRRVDR